MIELGSLEGDTAPSYGGHLTNEEREISGDEARVLVEVWSYRGRVTEKRAYCHWELTPKARMAMLSRPSPHLDVYAKRPNADPVLLSPYFSWTPSELGQQRYLGYLASEKSDEEGQRFNYVTLGDATPFVRREAHLKQDLEEIKKCFRTPTGHQKKKAS